MSDSVAMLFIVAHVAVAMALVHCLSRKTRIEITNQFSDADTDLEDDPADAWKRSKN